MNLNNVYAPIVMFVYNRPLHTKKVIEALLKNPESSETDLFIFADGPKTNATDEVIDDIHKTRDYIHTITGFKSITIEESEKNKGLAPATIYGCTKVINVYGKMIMIEDDDIPTPFFLGYANTCLLKFRDDKSVWCISGYTETNVVKPKHGDDVYMVYRPSSWGFCTWKRCWDKVIWDLDTLKGIFSYKDVRQGFDKEHGKDSSYIMNDLLNGKNSSWSIRFHFSTYLHHGKTILPNYSQIDNTGFDGSGTHCGNLRKKQLLMGTRPIVVPDIVKFDNERNNQLKKSVYATDLKSVLKRTYQNSDVIRSFVHFLLPRKLINKAILFLNKN